MTLALRSIAKPRLVSGGIAVCGPPCSMFVSASQSVHQRRLGNIWGDEGNLRVRCANRIWLNFAGIQPCCVDFWFHMISAPHIQVGEVKHVIAIDLLPVAQCCSGNDIAGSAQVPWNELAMTSGNEHEWAGMIRDGRGTSRDWELGMTGNDWDVLLFVCVCEMWNDLQVSSSDQPVYKTTCPHLLSTPCFGYKDICS